MRDQGLPSGIDCNGCGIELDVGVRHECPVLGTIVTVTSLGDRSGIEADLQAEDQQQVEDQPA